MSDRTDQWQAREDRHDQRAEALLKLQTRDINRLCVETSLDVLNVERHTQYVEKVFPFESAHNNALCIMQAAAQGGCTDPEKLRVIYDFALTITRPAADEAARLSRDLPGVQSLPALPCGDTSAIEEPSAEAIEEDAAPDQPA